MITVNGESWNILIQSYVCIPDDPRLSSVAPSNPAYIYRTWDRPHQAYTRIDRFPGCRCQTRCRVDCNRINSGNPHRPGRVRRFSHPDNSRATSPRILPPGYRELKKHATVSVAETYRICWSCSAICLRSRESHFVKNVFVNNVLGDIKLLYIIYNYILYIIFINDNITYLDVYIILIFT